MLISMLQGDPLTAEILHWQVGKQTNIQNKLNVRERKIIMGYNDIKTCFDMLPLQPWWRHQMETVSALLSLCEGNPPVTGGFPLTKASDTEFWCFLWSAPEQTVEQTI